MIFINVITATDDGEGIETLVNVNEIVSVQDMPGESRRQINLRHGNPLFVCERLEQIRLAILKERRKA